MGNDAKLGLVLGLGLVLTIGVIFFKKESATANAGEGQPAAALSHVSLPPPAPPAPTSPSAPLAQPVVPQMEPVVPTTESR